MQFEDDEGQLTRRAKVRMGNGQTAAGLLDAVSAYLPHCYVARVEGDDLLIEGVDDHGWTLDGYVIPRLASGLHAAYEIDP